MTETFDALAARALESAPSEWEPYYAGKVQLKALGLNLPPRTRVLERTASFPKLAVDVLAEVLVPEGYTLDGDDETPKLLARWWEANDLDTAAHLGIVEALVTGCAYWTVGYGRPGVPRITVHGPQGMACSYDHMGQIEQAVRRYQLGATEFAAHYLPGKTVHHRRVGGRWLFEHLDEHGAPRPAVVPMVNKARLGDVNGRSEIAELAGVSDAASRTLTGMQLAQESIAMPLRYLFGDGLDALVGDDPSAALELYWGKMLVGPSGATAGQVAGATLQDFHSTYKLYAQDVSATTGIPPAMLGIATDNPSSAEAMRVAKERLISKAETRQAMFGDALEDVARLALEMEGRAPENLDTLRLHWRDPAVPSASAQAANLLQAYATGVVSAETAREGLRLSPAQRARESARGQVLVAQDRQLGMDDPRA